jgi:hypothetical protein
MAESKAASVEYEDIEPSDFARFVEYAYRHDYTVPSWTRDESVEVEVRDISLGSPSSDASFSDVEPSPNAPFEAIRTRAYEIISERNTPQSTMLEYKIRNRNYLICGDPKAAMLHGFEYKGRYAPADNFGPVFLGHAWLYTFPCMRLVEPLKHLALHKLHIALMDFHLYDERLIDVIELARYAYDHGENRREDGTIEDLRMLVVEYIASELSTFKGHKDFVEMLEEGGEFVTDFWFVAVKEQLV